MLGIISIISTYYSKIELCVNHFNKFYSEANKLHDYFIVRFNYSLKEEFLNTSVKV